MIHDFLGLDRATGRNGGTMLTKGLTFTSFRIIAYAGSITDLQVIKDEIHGPIALTLERIHRYQRDSDELDPGHTAMIHLSGPDMVLVRQRWRGLAEREHLCLETVSKGGRVGSHGPEGRSVRRPV